MMVALAACGGTASSPGSPTLSPGDGTTPTLSPLPTASPSGGAAVQQLPEWFRTMVMRVSQRYGDPHPQQAWWALTSDEKAKLAGGNPGGDPAKQVYFAIVQGEFRSGQYQFFSLEADPHTHTSLGFVGGGGFDQSFVGPMAEFDLSALDTKENIVLFVTNQSIALSPVDIAVEIDGREVVDKLFRVGSQHTFERCVLRLSPGRHVLTARSAKGRAEVTRSFHVAGRRWIAVAYWYYTDQQGTPEPRHIDVRVSDQPMLWD